MNSEEGARGRGEYVDCVRFRTLHVHVLLITLAIGLVPPFAALLGAFGRGNVPDLLIRLAPSHAARFHHGVFARVDLELLLVRRRP